MNKEEILKEINKTKEQERERLKEWQEANQPTGICETCTAKSVEDKYKYKKVIEEIEASAKRVCDTCKKFIPKKQNDLPVNTVNIHKS